MKKAFLLIFIILLVISCKTTTVDEDPLSPVWRLLRDGDESAKGFFLGEINVNATDPDGRTPLHYAAERGDAQLAAFFIALGANPNVADFEGQTPLGISVEKNYHEVSKVLVDGGALIHQKIPEGRSPAALALEKGGLVFKSIITPTSAESTDSDGKNILHLAAIMGNIQAVNEITSVLNPSTSYINKKDSIDKNALDYALERPDSRNHMEIAEHLILSGGISENPIFDYFGPAARSSNYNMRRNEGLAPIHYAVIDNHLGLFTFLMEKKVNINIKSTSGATPLHESVRNGNIHMTTMLIANGADVNAIDAKGNTPLHTGIPSEVHFQIVKLLLETGADPNIRDEHGDTPLHIAIILNRPVSVIEALIAGGSDVHIRNINGKTPLFIAVQEERASIIPSLLSAGSEVFASDNSGKTPFDAAIRINGNIFNNMITPVTVGQRDTAGNTMLHATILNRGNVNQIGKILDQGAMVDARNRDGDTALHVAVRMDQRQNGEFLISRGANIFSLNAAGFSPLFIAFSPPSSSMREWIINPATTNAKDGLGNNMLHYASQWKLDHAIPIIIRNGISVEEPNATGQTPLFFAIRNDSPSTINVLVENNAKLTARDTQGNSLLHAAVRWNAKNSANLLIDMGADLNVFSLNGNTPLHDSVALGMSEMETLLINKKADLEVRNIDGNTPFMEAVRGGLVSSIDKLAANGADPMTRNIRGDTPLHVAVSMERTDLVTMILRMGTSIHARNTRNRTPFQIALGVSPAMVSTLLASGRINSSDDMGNSALHVALQERASSDIIRIIVSNGARINAVDNNGKTPLRLAVDLNMWEAAKIISDSGADPFMAAVDNKSPAEISFVKGLECIRALFSGRAINARDSSGNTILHIAARYGTPDVINILIQLGANRTIRNIASESPYDIALRWNKNDNSEALR